MNNKNKNEYILRSDQDNKTENMEKQYLMQKTEKKKKMEWSSPNCLEF